MNLYSVFNETQLQQAAHFAQTYLSELNPNADQYIEINPAQFSQYRLLNKPVAQQPELIVYAKQFSSMQFKYITDYCIKHHLDINSCRIIQAPDEQADCAISWQITSLLSEEAFSELVDWAAPQKIELWQLNKRPNLAEPGLLLMDMDSTTIKIECIDEIAKLAGVGQQVAEVTELAMQGKLDFAESLRARVGTLKDCDQAVLQKVADNLPLMHGLERLILNLKKYNWRVAIASGGFTFFADQLKSELGLDAAVANSLEIEQGKLTGQVLGEIVDAQVKARTLTELAQEFEIKTSQTIAMGDGANDLVMMSAANLGVAFEAKPIVQQKADVAINYNGLDALLFMIQ